MIPASARDAAACSDLDVAGLEAAAREGSAVGTVLFAIVLDGKSAVVVNVMAQRIPLENREEIVALLDGLRGTLGPASANVQPTYDLRTVREIQGFRSSPMPGEDGQQVHVLAFAREGKCANVTVGVPAGADELGARVDAAVDASIVLPGSRIDHFGEPVALRREAAYGALAGRLVLLAAIGAAVVVALWRGRAGRGKTPGR